MATGDAISLYGALEASFAPGCVNTDLWKFYKTAGFKRENAKLSGGSPDQYRINEVPWEKYSDALKSTFANYGDVALVVLSRSSGEGADLPSGLDALKPYMTDGDYLRLCKEELDLLSNLTTLKSDGIFKKIVVLLNSSSTLQLDFMIAHPGNYGFAALPKLLTGEYNPSGRTVDIWTADFTADPSYQAIGDHRYTNYKVTSGSYTDGGTFNGMYNEYMEGVYMGYRYYETAAEVDPSFDYDKTVVFPFGYGLSYTTFTQELTDLSDDGYLVTAKVKVTNTGSTAGKEVVQLYYTAPYTELDATERIEKPACNLVAFSKTSLLEAGKSEELTLRFTWDDLTSYAAWHNNGNWTTGCYMLEAGD